MLKNNNDKNKNNDKTAQLKTVQSSHTQFSQFEPGW